MAWHSFGANLSAKTAGKGSITIASLSVGWAAAPSERKLVAAQFKKLEGAIGRRAATGIGERALAFAGKIQRKPAIGAGDGRYPPLTTYMTRSGLD